MGRQPFKGCSDDPRTWGKFRNLVYVLFDQNFDNVDEPVLIDLILSKAYPPDLLIHMYIV
jgi:hypothetical protein